MKYLFDRPSYHDIAIKIYDPIYVNHLIFTQW